MGHMCIEVRLVRIFGDFLRVYLSSQTVDLGVGVKCTELVQPALVSITSCILRATGSVFNVGFSLSASKHAGEISAAKSSRISMSLHGCTAARSFRYHPLFV